MKPLPSPSNQAANPAPVTRAPFVVPPLGGSPSIFVLLSALSLNLHAAELRLGTNQTPADWRAEKRLIDLHQHIGYTPERLKRAVKIMDAVGIGIGVNLSGGTVTSTNGALS